MTPHTRYRILAALLTALTACPVAFTQASKPADNDSASGKAALQFEPGQKALTPAKLVGRFKTLGMEETSGSVDLGFGPLNVKLGPAGRGYALGIDLDGDGKYSRPELVPVGPNNVAVFNFTRPGDPSKTAYRVLFTHVVVNIDKGAVKSVTAQCHPDYAWRTTIGKTAVRLVDDNLDGKLTQDGHDAILIPPSTVALPLLKTHAIDGRELDLDVDLDSLSLTYSPHLNTERGKVALPFRAPGLRSLVLRTDKSAFDVAAGASVPPGVYRLAYGVLAQGNDSAVIIPGEHTPAYPIKADFLNTLRLGPPLTVHFGGWYHANDNNYHIDAPGDIVGAGDEHYRLNHPLAARPFIALMEGRRVESSATMNYDRFGRLSGFGGHISKVGSPKDWVFQLAVPVPGMPSPATGARTIGEVSGRTPQKTPKIAGDPVRYSPLKPKPAN